VLPDRNSNSRLIQFRVGPPDALVFREEANMAIGLGTLILIIILLMILF
jgi:hypothetical protein